ncbi:MAG: acyltransferase [Promethearchaeota archaeon]
MFQPVSLKGDSPTPIDENIRKKFISLYLLIIILSFIPVSIMEYYIILYLWRTPFYLIFVLLFPLNLVIMIYLLQFSAIIVSFLLLKIVNLIHAPKEGIFNRNVKDKDYYFWNLRNIIKKWALFVAASNPFPWLKNRFTLRFFGVKIGKHTLCDNTWISSEFVNIGKNVILGMNSTILTFGIEQDKFILKRILIEDGALIGAKCVLLPGTIVEKKAKLGAHSYSEYNSILEKDSLYKGHPAKIVD